MLSSQFSPLNSFGINEDIFITFDNYPSIINIYNTIPNKIYNYINFPFNFGASGNFTLKYPDTLGITGTGNICDIQYINFYNFNQSKLKLSIPNSTKFLSNLYYFYKFNFNGDIELTFKQNNFNFDYFYCFSCKDYYPPEHIDMSNVIINFFGETKFDNSSTNFYQQNLGSEATARYMFYGSDLFNKEKTFKGIYIPFLYFDDLTYCFGCSENYYERQLDTKVNCTLSDLLILKNYDNNPKLSGKPVLKNINWLFSGRFLEDDYYTKHPEGFIGTDLSLPKLENATSAFQQLNFKEIDIENLLNAISTKTDGKEHQIGMGGDVSITEEKINEYINQFNQKGWTATILQTL